MQNKCRKPKLNIEAKYPHPVNYRYTCGCGWKGKIFTDAMEAYRDYLTHDSKTVFQKKQG